MLRSHTFKEPGLTDCDKEGASTSSEEMGGSERRGKWLEAAPRCGVADSEPRAGEKNASEAVCLIPVVCLSSFEIGSGKEARLDPKSICTSQGAE